MISWQPVRDAVRLLAEPMQSSRAIFAAIVFSIPVLSSAADLPAFSPDEKKAWEAIAARFTSEPKIKTDNAKVIEIAVAGLKDADRKGENGTASVTLSKATGKVVTVTSNAAKFTDDEVAGFSAFPELKALTLWHNSGPSFTGKGLAGLKDLPDLQSVTFAGGSFSDEGMKEAAKLPALKEVRAWHSKFSDEGIAAFRNHPTLESITVGPSWEKLITDKSLEALSTCPKLRKFGIAETWLTWEGGLSHLVKLKGVLKEVDFGNCIIEPAEMEKFRVEMPDTKIEWKGFSSGKDELKKSWIRPRAEKWIPKELLDRVMAGN